jgi:hypothetical protein
MTIQYICNIDMTTDKTIVLKTFLKQFTEFVDDIHGVFPNNHDIESAKNALILMKKTNPNMLISAWLSSMCPYDDEIMAGNIDFFLEKNYDNDLEHMGNVVMQKVDAFKKPIKEMGSENQKKTMKYIQNLTKLAKLYDSFQIKK